MAKRECKSKSTPLIPCHLCSSSMIRISKKDGSHFYGCKDFRTTGCKGSLCPEIARKRWEENGCRCIVRFFWPAPLEVITNATNADFVWLN